MKKVFVTGGDGLLGSNVVRELLKRGHQVKVMIQPGSTSKTLEGLDIETVEADLLDKEKVIEVSQGSEIIINIAAITNVWPSRGAIYYKVNVEGAENMVEAALANKVERMVHIGSASAFGYGSKEKPGTENDPYKSAHYGLDYGDTKLLGQEKVLEAVRSRNLPAIVVSPTFMIGPYDSKPSSGAMILAVAKRQLPAFSPGGKNWVHVQDVAQGVCNAMTMGRIGESYILGGENMSFKEALTQAAEVLGAKPPRLTMPPFAIKLGGLFGSIFGSITKKAPKLSYPMARVACDGHYFSPEKARKELDLPHTPFKDAVKDAMDWFKANGYL